MVSGRLALNKYKVGDGAVSGKWKVGTKQIQSRGGAVSGKWKVGTKQIQSRGWGSKW